MNVKMKKGKNDPLGISDNNNLNLLTIYPKKIKHDQ